MHRPCGRSSRYGLLPLAAGLALATAWGWARTNGAARAREPLPETTGHARSAAGDVRPSEDGVQSDGRPQRPPPAPDALLQSAVTITRTLPPERYALVDSWPAAPAAPRGIQHPAGLSVGEDGLVYVAMPRSDRIGVWHMVGGAAPAPWTGPGAPPGPRGNMLTPEPALGGPGVLRAPVDAAVDSKAGRLYVADSGARRVAVLATRGGALLAEWPVEGRPAGIALGPDGKVYVADETGHRVRVYDSTGTHLADWGGFGRGLGQLDRPAGLAVGPKDGFLYVADSGNQRVQWFDGAGQAQGRLLLDNSAGPGGTPQDVFVNDKGQIHVAVERGVLRYNSPTSYVATERPILELPANVPPVTMANNHEGIRGLGYHPKAGWAVSLDPALWSGDGLDSYPARWFPAFGSFGSAWPAEPYRIAGDGRGSSLLDSRPGAWNLAADGRLDGLPAPTPLVPHDQRHWDLARWDRCLALLDDNLVTLSSDQSRGCPVGQLEVLDQNQRSRRDRVGDLVPDPGWWNRALALNLGGTPNVAVLDAGKGRLVLRSLNPMGQLVGGVQLVAQNGPLRPFADVAYDAFGTAWVLAKDGGLLPVDRRGRTGDEVTPDLGGRGAEALALGPEGEFFVLATDGWVFKAARDGSIRAAWDARWDGAGGAVAYADLTVDEAGRVLLTDSRLDRLLVWAPEGGPGQAVDRADGPPCRLVPDKRAAPARLALGDTTTVTLSVATDCGEAWRALDIVLVVDAGCDMAGERLAKLREAGIALAGALRQDRDQVAVVSFSTEVDGKEGGARLLLPLTADRAAASAALGGLKTSCLPLAFLGITPSYPMDLAGGLRAGREALFGPAGRTEAGKVLIVLSPRSQTPRRPALWEARRLWQAGVRVYSLTVGQDSLNQAKDGPDRGLIAALASRGAGYQEVGAPNALPAILKDLGLAVSDRHLLRDIRVVDRIPANMRLDPGSISPPATVLPDGALEWHFQNIGWEGLPPLSFRLEPLVAGVWPTNIEARGAYTDGLGYDGSILFPVPYVEVIGPTPSPTASSEPSATVPPTASATPTATPSPTRVPRTASPTPTGPRRLFLPVLFYEQCIPKARPVDVALAIDTSSSMLGAKLEAAKTAAGAFLDQLDLRRDRAAVVGFGATARLAQPLSADRSALDGALAALGPGVGTRIDEGLWAALNELTGARRRAGADPVIVLLTDGRPQEGTEGRIRQASALARQLGVAVYAVGLGEDVLPEVLRDIAGDPSRVFLAPDARDLADIYRQVARVIPCR